MPDSLVATADGNAVPIEALTPEALAALEGESKQWVEATGFAASAGEVALIPRDAGSIDRVLFGLGAGESPDADRLLAGKLPVTLPPGTYTLAGGFDDPALATLAWALGAYRFTRYRSDGARPRRLVVSADVDAAEVARIADAVYLVRDLINTAANDLGPAELGNAVHELAGRYGAVFSETVGEGLLADNLPLIHAVGAAATEARAPRLVELSWGDPDAPRVTLVGKGVCFDTGGLDLKPASGMRLMKKDMGGAANAIGLARMIMDARLPVRLRLLVPAVENAVAAAAFRPGDVLRSRKGLTVEIGNTDAEGRLILADALTLAAEETPDLLVDFATLTGAARVALGPEVVPVYTNDERLAADVARLSAAVADPVWRMPLWRPYARMIDSPVADINNAGSSPHAGSITAALFLARFVPDDVSWLHADIFAWNPSTAPGKPEGGDAQTIRALYALLKERYARAN